MKYVEYLQTDGTLIMWDTGVKVFQNGDNVTLDFMPFSGNPVSTPFNPFLNDFSNGDYSGCNVAIKHFYGYNENSTELYFADNSYKNVPFVSGTRYNIFMDSGGMYVDGVKVNTLAAVNFVSENSVATIKVNAEIYNGQMRRSPIARYYEVKVGSSNGLKADLKPCLDDNNVPCFYDEVSQTLIYHSGSGTPIAGPLLSSINVSADKTRVPASGGTINVTVNSDYDWTASSTGNWYTMSSTSGTSADTAITITVPSTTSVTQVEDTILFTNATGDTDSLTIKQLKYSVGVNNFFVGTENVEGMMIGGQEVEAIYLGTEVVYSPGPFVGLKVRPSEISFANESGLTSELKIKSSESWALDIPNDATWLSASTLSGDSGETIVTLETIEENTGSQRTAVITATTANFSGTCEVTQYVIEYVDWIFTTNPTNNSDYRDGIEIGDVWSADAEFRIKGTMQGYSTGKGVLTNYDGRSDVATRWFWTGGNMYYDMNGGRLQTSFTPTSGVNFDYTISNWGVYNNLTSSYVMSGTPKQSINAGVVWLNMRTCKISSLEIKQGNTVVFDGKAAVDNGQGIVGLYDTVSGDWFYNSGLSMTYGTSGLRFVDYVYRNPIGNMTNYYIETNIYPTTATTMRFKFQGKGLDSSAKYVGFSFGTEEDKYKGASDSSDYRLLKQWDTTKLGFDIADSRIASNSFPFGSDGVDYDLTLGNYYVYDNINEAMVVSGTPKTGGITPNIPIMVNVSCIWLKSLEIWEGQTKVFDGKAAVDDVNNIIGLYDSVSKSWFYNPNLSMTYVE